MRVIGFDPGYGITGWGVVERKPDLAAVDYGAIMTSPGIAMGERLLQIFNETQDILHRLQPSVAVVEMLFFNQNRTTAGPVYEARGVILAALAGCSIPVLELGPGTIKQAVTGHGRSAKPEMMRMVERILGLSRVRPDDAADALAAAIAGIAHCATAEFRDRVEKRR